MSCGSSFADYAFRSLGYGERLLPRGEISFCDQVVLIGSGILWNIYFAVIAIGIGFALATVLALGKARPPGMLNWLASGFVYFFRGTPLFIQFFFAYALFVQIPKVSVEIPVLDWVIESRWLTTAWLGALIVLILNTAAYSAEIFYGALKAVPRGEIEAADAMGMSERQKFRRVVWPTMLRLAWPSYTNEAIFMFHATALVFLASFPAWRQKGDALYYAQYFAKLTFNPFVAYPIVATYFVLVTLLIIWGFGRVNARLNRHLPQTSRRRLRIRPGYIR